MLLLCPSATFGICTSSWEVILHEGEWPHDSSIALNVTGTKLPVTNTEEDRQVSVSFWTR